MTQYDHRLTDFSQGEKTMIKLRTKMMLLAGLGILTLLPGAWASERDQKTVFTFSGPVEIPGQILPAGTYVFRLADSSSNRNIIQVFNKDENRLFGTFLAISDYRLRPSEKTIIRFAERTAGSPQAIKGWFYPGRNHGHEFVYPKKEALELAKVNHTPVPSMPSELSVDTTITSIKVNGPEYLALVMAPLKVEEPTGEEVELAKAFPAADTGAAAQGAGLPEKLPSTATPLPLIGLIGLLSLGTAATLRIAAVRAK
jgi:hypothetical protein